MPLVEGVEVAALQHAVAEQHHRDRRADHGPDLARGLGADLAAVGWVQKVSNLILNLNLQVRDVATGQMVAAGTVDIRGNTDESWQRGLLYLLDHRILPQHRPG